MFQNVLKYLFTSINKQNLELNSSSRRTAALLISHFSTSKKDYPFPPIIESEIVETFSNGSGPGGQKTNKTHNRCQLKHLPTGIIVSSHHTRSLEENRKIARRMLQERLDMHYNKESSFIAQQQKIKAKSREIKRKRSIENLEKKREFKKRELD